MEKSTSIAELAAALAKAQGAMGLAKMDTENPAFKRGNIVSRYADLASIVATIKAPLSNNGLAYSQAIAVSEAETFLETILMHVSGEWIASSMPVRPLQNTPQALGSALTYARRYSISSLVGLAASEEDDDGNAATASPNMAAKPALQHAPERVAKAVVPAPAAADTPPATGTTGLMDPEQKAKIWNVASKGLGYTLGELKEIVTNHFEGKKLDGLTKTEANQLLGLLSDLMDAEAKGAKA